MTSREKAIAGAFTGVHFGDFSAMHEYIEEIMGRPVFTHEMGYAPTVKEIKEASKQDFIAMCEAQDD